MKYMMLIYTDERDWESASPEEWDAIMAAWADYVGAATEAGVFVSTEALQPTAAATLVRRAGGRTLVTDGPFAETKEQIGGFCIFDVSDRDEAIRWAERCPAGPTFAIELRPLMVFDERPAA